MAARPQHSAGRRRFPLQTKALPASPRAVSTKRSCERPKPLLKLRTKPHHRSPPARLSTPIRFEPTEPAPVHPVLSPSPDLLRQNLLAAPRNQSWALPREIHVRQARPRTPADRAQSTL